MAIILLNISLKEFALISDKTHGLGKHYTHRMYQTISHFYETKFNCTIFYNFLLVKTQHFRITRSSKLRQNSTKTFIPSVTSGKELMTGIFQPKSFSPRSSLYHSQTPEHSTKYSSSSLPTTQCLPHLPKFPLKKLLSHSPHYPLSDCMCS